MGAEVLLYYLTFKATSVSAAIRVIDFCPYTLNPGMRTMLNFTKPRDIAFDDEGTLYYTTSNHCINKYFLADKTTVTCFVGVMELPEALMVHQELEGSLLLMD